MDKKSFIGKKCCTKDKDYYIKLGFKINNAGWPTYGIDEKYIPEYKFNKNNLIVKKIRSTDWVELYDPYTQSDFFTWFKFLVFEQQKKENKI